MKKYPQFCGTFRTANPRRVFERFVEEALERRLKSMGRVYEGLYEDFTYQLNSYRDWSEERGIEVILWEYYIWDKNDNGVDHAQGFRDRPEAELAAIDAIKLLSSPIVSGPAGP